MFDIRTTWWPKSTLSDRKATSSRAEEQYAMASSAMVANRWGRLLTTECRFRIRASHSGLGGCTNHNRLRLGGGVRRYVLEKINRSCWRLGTNSGLAFCRFEPQLRYIVDGEKWKQPKREGIKKYVEPQWKLFCKDDFNALSIMDRFFVFFFLVWETRKKTTDALIVDPLFTILLYTAPAVVPGRWCSYSPNCLRSQACLLTCFFS